MSPKIPRKRRQQREQWFDGDALRERRRFLGLDIHAVGKRVGRSHWTIYRYEQGAANPLPKVYAALLKVLKLKHGALVRINADKSRSQ